jgi:hypothetical protein
MMHHHLYARIS